ncbi:MAG: tetratricopeptide repeat protein [bacterium]
MNADDPIISGWLQQARDLLNEKKFLHAIQLYYKITTEVPELDLPWVELGYAQFELKQYEAAEKSVLRALAVTSSPNDIYFLAGNMYLKRGYYNKALVYYKKLQIGERSLRKELRSHLNFNMGLAYYSLHNGKLAEQHFRRARRANPDFPRINESLGELLIRRGAFQEAITFLTQALEADPKSWICHYLLGVAYAKLQLWKASYDEFAIAIEIDPNEPRAWQMCGEVLLSIQRLDEAERYLHRALELNPMLTDAVVDVGYLFLKRGDLQRARDCFEQALLLEPKNAKAMKAARELKQLSTS